MSSNKLSLLVNFVGVDKMSGSLRNIMALGKKGSRSLNELRAGRSPARRAMSATWSTANARWRPRSKTPIASWNAGKS